MINRIEKEKGIVRLMIKYYCRKQHKSFELCNECEELIDYSCSKLDACRYGETKFFCSICKTHCYNKVQREKIRAVMKYSGPRMIIYMPIEYIKHLFKYE